MKKKTLIDLLDSQKTLTKKNTRQDIISVVRDLVDRHINANAEINGVEFNRSNNGVNLGSVVEVITKSLYGAKTDKASSNDSCDFEANGKKYEVKFSTSDAYAHAINPNEKVDYYLIITYTKALGGQAFKVPYSERHSIITNNQDRVITNQKVKFLDKELTSRLFA